MGILFVLGCEDVKNKVMDVGLWVFLGWCGYYGNVKGVLRVLIVGLWRGRFLAVFEYLGGEEWVGVGCVGKYE